MSGQPTPPFSSARPWEAAGYARSLKRMQDNPAHYAKCIPAWTGLYAVDIPLEMHAGEGALRGGAETHLISTAALILANSRHGEMKDAGRL